MRTTNYVYLDWNAMKDIQKGEKTEFIEAVKKFKQIKLFPFSFAHLSDLQKNADDNLHYIFYDLATINQITDGYMIGRYKDDFGIDRINVFEKFREVSGYTIPLVEPLSEEEVVKIKDMGLKQYLKTGNNIEKFPNVMLSALDAFNSNHELYKIVREMFKTEKENTMDFIETVCSGEFSNEEFKQAVEEYMKFSNVDTSLFGSTLTYAYMILEFCPGYSDKINKKTSFSNVYNDGQHMLYAHEGQYYITNDKKTKKKTEFVFNVYDVKCKVLDPNEFIDLVKRVY